VARISDLNTPDATAVDGDRSEASEKHSSQPGQPAPAQNLHQLIEAQIPRLTRYARVLTRDPVAADDLVQECLTRALGKMHLWEEGTDLRAWLFTILHLNMSASRAGKRASAPAPNCRNLTGAWRFRPVRPRGSNFAIWSALSPHCPKSNGR